MACLAPASGPLGCLLVDGPYAYAGAGAAAVVAVVVYEGSCCRCSIFVTVVCLLGLGQRVERKERSSLFSLSSTTVRSENAGLLLYTRSVIVTRPGRASERAEGGRAKPMR